MDARVDWTTIAMDRLSDDETFITARIEQLDELLLKLSRDRDEFLQRVERAEQDIVDSARLLQERMERDKNHLLDVIRETEGTYRHVYEKSRTDIERSIERMKDFQSSSTALRTAACDDAITLDALHNRRNKLDMIRHNITRSTLQFTPTNTQDTILASRENVIGNVTFHEAIGE